jgi:uncharacterized secreted repeat protein (TIGR03808 family)
MTGSILRPRPTRRALLWAGGRLLAAAAGAAAGLVSPAAGRKRPRRVLRAERLGLAADPRRDQTDALRRALRAAARADAWLRLPKGTVVAGEIDFAGAVRLLGGRGRRLALARGARYLLRLAGGPVLMEGVEIDGRGRGRLEDALLAISGADLVRLRECVLHRFDGHGLRLEECGGAIHGCRMERLGNAALFATDCTGLRIIANRVRRCANNGILVWQSEKRPDGAVIAGNDIGDIGARLGGDGPNGNGINVFRAGGVTVRDNRIRKCAFTAIRNNSGDDCRIIDNDCADLGEVAIFVEFAWRRAVVRGNRIRRASAGISATNLDHGGRGALIEDNVVEDVRPRIRSVDVLGYGIAAEADALVRGNVVRNASQCGLAIGWGPYLENVRAIANRLEDCTYGIAVSVTAGAGRAELRRNVIIRPRRGAIVGFDHALPATGELIAADNPPPHLTIADNRLVNAPKRR